MSLVAATGGNTLDDDAVFSLIAELGSGNIERRDNALMLLRLRLSETKQ